MVKVGVKLMDKCGNIFLYKKNIDTHLPKNISKICSLKDTKKVYPT